MSSPARAATRRVAPIAAIAVAIVAILITISQLGAPTTAKPAPTIQRAAAVESLLAGIPQDGIALGNPDAPVTVVEFADLKCPACKAFSDALLPGLVRDYVRSGKVRIEFRAQHFVGEQLHPGDSQAAARMALAAAEQDRLWSFVELFYANQRDESTRYASDAFLRRLGAATAGLDVDRALATRSSAAVTDALATSAALFARHGLAGTPSFIVDGEFVAASELTAAIDAALKR